MRNWLILILQWSGETVGKRIAAAYGKTTYHTEGEGTGGASSDESKELNIRGFGDKGLEK